MPIDPASNRSAPEKRTMTSPTLFRKRKLRRMSTDLHSTGPSGDLCPTPNSSIEEVEIIGPCHLNLKSEESSSSCHLNIKSEESSTEVTGNHDEYQDSTFHNGFWPPNDSNFDPVCFLVRLRFSFIFVYHIFKFLISDVF